MALTGELYETIVHIVKDQVGEIKVNREDFNKLTKTVEGLSEALRELAEAQKRTEAVLSGLGERVGTLEVGMERLERAVEELAQAQKRTEAVVAGLGERVGTLEVGMERLERAVEELAQAQKRTEAVVSTLGERTTRLEGALERLAEAQKRTELALQELAEAQKRTDQTVGRLTDTIGHDLESVARVNVPDWLRLYQGVKVPELKRRVFKVDGEEIEVDLYGEGMKGRVPATIVGEAKSTIHGRDVEAFSTRVDRLKNQLQGRLVKIMFGYWIHPSAQQEARKMQIHVIAPPGTYSRGRGRSP